jgi:FkbM family methyltransferase
MLLPNFITNHVWLARTCRDWQTFRWLKGWEKDKPEARGRLRVRPLHGGVWVRSRSTDVSVVWELFSGREYELERNIRVESVLDLGANIGVFAAFTAARFGSTLKSYIGVEPDPESFEMLEKNIVEIELKPRARIIRGAVSDRCGTLRFNNGVASWARCVDESGKLEVRALTVNAILEEAGLPEVDLMKVDIEGSERELMEAAPSWRHLVKALVVELHSPLNYEWFRTQAEAAGYTAYPKGELFHGHPGAIRNP